jgi:integrase
LKIAPYVFVRPRELRHAEWSEFELESETPTWKIPAKKIKIKQTRIVPLATSNYQFEQDQSLEPSIIYIFELNLLLRTAGESYFFLKIF